MLGSVEFVNFHFNEDLDCSKKGIGWVIITLCEEIDDLRLAMTAIMEDNSMLKLYDEGSAYLWKNRGDLLEAWEVLKGKEFPLPTEPEILTGYREWKAQKAR